MTEKLPKTDPPRGPGKSTSSVFDTRSVDDIYDEVIGLYKGDGRPWVVGFSGGKDELLSIGV